MIRSINKQQKRFGVSRMIALSLSTGLLITGCMTSEEANSAPHSETPATYTSPDAHNSDGSLKITQCGAFTPDKEQVVCTMQYDPVCVKHKAPDGKISYKTAGNACSACNTATAISYTPGECSSAQPSQ